MLTKNDLLIIGQLLDQKFENLAIIMKNGFDIIHKRFDDVYERFDEIDARFEHVYAKFDEVHAEIADVRKDISNIKNDITDIRSDIARLTIFPNTIENRVTKNEDDIRVIKTKLQIS